MLNFVSKTGAAIESVFEPLAHLRIAVFHHFPYLYAGSLEYEKAYLRTYFAARQSFLFAVYHHNRMVGATTAIPLPDETEEVRLPFEQAGYNLNEIFYFGESILLPEYRGQGLGHRFFDEREAHARSFRQYRYACFCAVDRPYNHPHRPADYQPLDGFWKKRGYVRIPALKSTFSWTDIGQQQPTEKPMLYWMKAL